MGIVLSSLVNVVTRFSVAVLFTVLPVSGISNDIEITTTAEVINKIDYAQRQETIEQKVEQPVEEKKEEPVKEEKKEQKVVKEEVANNVISTFSGRLTSYTAYCSGCSEAGNVACHTANGGKHSLKTNGQYYNDLQFGSVRILAADRSYPCGTIIRVTAPVLGGSFLAVVLDRGGAIKGDLFDLAYEGTQNGGFGVLREVKYEVLRTGW